MTRCRNDNYLMNNEQQTPMSVRCYYLEDEDTEPSEKHGVKKTEREISNVRDTYQQGSENSTYAVREASVYEVYKFLVDASRKVAKKEKKQEIYRRHLSMECVHVEGTGCSAEPCNLG